MNESCKKLLFEISVACVEWRYTVLKSHVCADAAVRISIWSRDDSRHVKVFNINMPFDPLRLVLVANNLIILSLIILPTAFKSFSQLQGGFLARISEKTFRII